MKYRNVVSTIKGNNQVDGAGVKLKRVLTNITVKEFDPFLMLDIFDSTNPADYIKGFPWHPHRGIETVTYILEGSVEHGDSLGNSGVISSGDCQWMTAGSGIIHQEMPQVAERMLGIQLWINLPRNKKMTAPAYMPITLNDIPIYEEYGVLVNVISGECGGKTGAVKDKEITMLDISIQPDMEWHCKTPSAHNVFIYTLEGKATFNGSQNAITAHNAILFSSGDEVYIRSGSEGARMILFGGKPLQEPVAWGGPIVMNTKEELHTAFKEIENNTFIKIKPY